MSIVIVKKIIINALIAKKGAGGGFQIALNFIKETLTSDHNVEWFYFVSEDLNEDLKNSFSSYLNKSYFVFQTQPDINTFLTVKRKIDLLEKRINPDLVYSILAPSYFKFKTVEVMRIANAWNTNMNKLAFRSLNTKQKIFFLSKRILSRHLMRKSKYFITQTNTLKNGIIKNTHVPESNVKVVSNVLPLIYKDHILKKNKTSETFNIVYVAAPVAHKKIDLIPYIAKLLIDKYNFIDFTIYVTIPVDCSFNLIFNDLVKKIGVEKHIINLGYQTQSDLICLYSKCDIGLFPSLLETFSATLLEYMKFELPIVASNFDFNIDVAQNAALYFNPNDIDTAAKHLYNLMNNKKLYTDLQINGSERLKNYSDYSEHFNNTVGFLFDIIESQTSN